MILDVLVSPSQKFKRMGGDGGIVTTNNAYLNEKIRLIRNHGLKDRNTCIEFSYNSRLDSIQAVIAKHLIENKLENITKRRISNANLFDSLLKDIPQIKLLKDQTFKKVFHLYIFSVENRDGLANYLKGNGVDAKIHYPVPMHLQPAAKKFNYNRKDFKKCRVSCRKNNFIASSRIYFRRAKLYMYQI